MPVAAVGGDLAADSAGLGASHGAVGRFDLAVAWCGGPPAAGMELWPGVQGFLRDFWAVLVLWLCWGPFGALRDHNRGAVKASARRISKS